MGVENYVSTKIHITQVGEDESGFGYVVCVLLGAISMLLFTGLLAWAKKCQDSARRGHTRFSPRSYFHTTFVPFILSHLAFISPLSFVCTILHQGNCRRRLGDGGNLAWNLCKIRPRSKYTRLQLAFIEIIFPHRRLVGTTLAQLRPARFQIQMQMQIQIQMQIHLPAQTQIEINQLWPSNGVTFI